ncbi:MAG: RNA polymerase sigma factor [Pirellulales bacterium]|nr:RNA polymerase sigma factor [Pirellulales bacterium]
MTPPQNCDRTAIAGPVDLADPRSFAAHYRAAYSRLALVAAGMIGDRTAAEDVVQDAAIIAFQRAAQFTPGTNFAAWMAEIVRRCALNYRRKAKHRKTYPADPALLSQVEHQGAGGESWRSIASLSGDMLEDQGQFDDELIRALKQLSPEARCCLLLRTVERLSYAEIAALMHMPEGTAMSHVHRSRTALRRALSREPAAHLPASEAAP